MGGCKNFLSQKFLLYNIQCIYLSDCWSHNINFPSYTIFGEIFHRRLINLQKVSRSKVSATMYIYTHGLLYGFCFDLSAVC